MRLVIATCTVDYEGRLAAHLAAGILCLFLLSGAAQPAQAPAAAPTSPEARAAVTGRR